MIVRPRRMQPHLSFVVIGAMKAGTTTLHLALRNSPDVAVPEAKEAPFFADPEMFVHGEAWFFETFFGANIPDLPLGTVTPQYMYTPEAMRRLHAHNPKLRITAILRDPIERAVSHHSMMKRRGTDPRDVVEALLASLSDDEFGYLDRGRYGAMCTNWVQCFGPEQLALLDYAWLAQRPEYIVAEVERHIGARVTTADLGKVTNATQRAPGTESLRRLLRSDCMAFARRRLPRGLRKRAWLRLERGFAVSGTAATLDLPQDVRAKLNEWFAADRRELLDVWAMCSQLPAPAWT